MLKSQGSWHVLVIPAMERRSQAAPEDSLSRQAVTICEHQANERPCLKQKLGGMVGMISERVLWPLNTCTHVCTLLHINTGHIHRMLT